MKKNRQKESKRGSPILECICQMPRDLHAAGVLDERTMRRFDEAFRASYSPLSSGSLKLLNSLSASIVLRTSGAVSVRISPEAQHLHLRFGQRALRHLVQAGVRAIQLIRRFIESLLGIAQMSPNFFVGNAEIVELFLQARKICHQLSRILLNLLAL